MLHYDHDYDTEKDGPSVTPACGWPHVAAFDASASLNQLVLADLVGRPQQPPDIRAICAYVGTVELWSAGQAARHWHVSPARARSILADRGIRRVSGYPANEVRGVSRRQGARTDLAAPAQAFSLSETSEAIGRSSDDRTRLRIFFEFTRGADESGPAALALTSSEPSTTGDARYDALLAAIAEHLAGRYGLPGPLWSCTVGRFLEVPWWISPLPSGRAQAMVWTPASFRRRGIFLDRHDLTHDGVAPMPEPLFDHSELRRAFTALADKLRRRRIVGQVHVVGGAAMILAYDQTRTATRDIDALFSPDGPMIAAIREVATEHGWPSTWLNNQAAGYVSRTPGEGSLVFDHPHLQVAATPPRHLLAMKVLAARAIRDTDDIRILLKHLGITQRAEVWAIVERYFPDTGIPERSQQLVEDLLNDE